MTKILWARHRYVVLPEDMEGVQRPDVQAAPTEKRLEAPALRVAGRDKEDAARILVATFGLGEKPFIDADTADGDKAVTHRGGH